MSETARIIQALAEPFPIWDLGFKGKATGFEAVYADPRAFTKRLNEVLPGGWSIEITNNRTDGNGNLTCEGVLTLYFPTGPRTFVSTGTEPPDTEKNGGVKSPKAEKGLDSDAFKRACYRAGVACYVYELQPKTEYSLSEIRRAAFCAGWYGEIEPYHYGKAGVVGGDGMTAFLARMKGEKPFRPEPASPESVPQNGKAAQNGRAADEVAAPAAFLRYPEIYERVRRLDGEDLKSGIYSIRQALGLTSADSFKSWRESLELAEIKGRDTAEAVLVHLQADYDAREVAALWAAAGNETVDVETGEILSPPGSVLGEEAPEPLTAGSEQHMDAVRR